MVTGTLGYVIGKWLMKKHEEVYDHQFKAKRVALSLVRQ
jgi:hypothetical protein